jgi:alpha-galactosidase
MKSFHLNPLCFLPFFICSICFSQTIVTQKKDSLFIVVDGKTIFEGLLSSPNADKFKILHQSRNLEGASLELITITAGLSKSFELNGTIIANEEAIVVESDPRDHGLKVIRHSVGQSQNLLNNAIYDRKNDWLLSFDSFYPKLKITPGKNQFQIAVKGWEIVIRFKPEYYQKHRGLKYFDPATHTLYKKPIVGWCSWFAYFDKVTEKDIVQVTQTVAEKLKPYGLEYIQIDDGYQQLPIGPADHWLTANKKFPRGLGYLANYIHQQGMTPGIWTNVAFADSSEAKSNPQFFIRGENEKPVKGNWVDFVVDGSNPETISKYITPVYQGLKAQGWRYFKVDALRHLKYEGYNSYSEYFSQRKTDRNEAFRNVVKAVRASIGTDVPLMACWGIRPELVGIVDACRIGNDGYSYAGLAQYNSYNNIIWRNDPDHIELSDQEAYRSCVATSLTGSLFMLTDKPEKYNSPLAEAAIRSIPVLFTQPGQVYDVDPSKSSKINLADVEMSGSGPRPFDASSTTTTGLFAQEINRSFENWLVLGRLDERDNVLPFRDLGLSEEKEYLVFEFWTKQFKGVFSKQYEPGAIDKKYNCQVLCLREKTNHPQLLATNRHISCGGVDLVNMNWKDNALSGQSEIVPLENYVLYVYEPESRSKPSVECDHAQLVKSSKEGMMRIIEVKPEPGTKLINWKIQY